MALIDLRRRKSVHVALLVDTHRDFRKTLIDRELSMQEAFQKFSELASAGDKRATKILDELVEEKKEAALSSKSRKIIDIRNIDTIYSLIGDESAGVEND